MEELLIARLDELMYRLEAHAQLFREYPVHPSNEVYESSNNSLKGCIFQILFVRFGVVN
ncbi:hypothetical protein [Desulfatiglans anilini]|uniref:hypothetical protein n=1 Tax=Desulfatiglans anilini TaxID=90728 RepID=UPI00041E9CC0|nr:hypothetical protein [Desulfatiglans anilini]